MEPGDIVVGKRKVNVDFSKAKASYNFLFGNRGTRWDDEIEVYSHKEAFLYTILSGGWTLREHDPEYKNFETKRFHFSKVKGMIVDFDPLDSKRPHIEGVAAVLIEDKVWWIVAGDLQVVRLGKGR